MKAGITRSLITTYLWNFFVWYVFMYRDNTYCFLWVRNLVSDIKGRTKTDGVSEQGAEENICTKEG
jgi:hypothetical protein